MAAIDTTYNHFLFIFFFQILSKFLTLMQNSWKEITMRESLLLRLSTYALY